ncbi:MAG: T9SS type A sorting domain-containing protein [Bacteroidia bacterium]|nr:T9SS type A sorting domain-containing protein [Bacteroidia bacterium]
MKVLFLPLLVVFCAFTANGQTPSRSASTISTIDVPRLFVMNEGQWDERVLASTMGPGPTVSFGSDGYSVGIETVGPMRATEGAVRNWPGMLLAHPSPDCRVEPAHADGSEATVYAAADSGFHPYTVPQYKAIVYRQAWPGVDITVRRVAAGLEHDIDVKAGADLSRLRLHFGNIAAGQLVLHAADGQDAATPRLSETAQGTDFSVGASRALRDFRVTLRYNFYWGGSHLEWGATCAVDRKGDVTLLGHSLSGDFPIHPAGSPGGGSGPFAMYLVKIPESGIPVRYSVSYNVGQWASYGIQAEIGKHDRLIVTFYTSTLDKIVTPDAEFPTTRTQGECLAVFDSSGGIVYATAIPDSAGGFTTFTTDADGVIYLATHTNGTPRYITPDAFMPVNQGGWDGVIMKFHPDTYKLTYATCIGGSADEFISAIAVDGCGSVAISGWTWSADYPLRNAVQNSMNGRADYVFTRFTADGKRLVFSTYLGGSAEEAWTWSGMYGNRSLRYAPNSDLYFYLGAYGSDFPLRNPLPLPPQTHGYNAVIGKFSPMGELRFSSWIYGWHAYWHASIDVDSCGNLIVSGSSFQDIPLVKPVYTIGNAFCAVVDTHIPEILFCTKLGWSVGHGSSVTWYSTTGVLNGTSVYLTKSGIHDPEVPATPGYPAAHTTDSTDIQITRIDLPDLCSRPVFHDKATDNAYVSLEFFHDDSLRIDERRGTHAPTTLRVHARLRNSSSWYSSDSLVLLLRLPGRTTLAPGSPPLRLVLPPLLPGDSTEVTWLLLPEVDSIRASVTLMGELLYSSGGECPSLDAREIPLHVEFTELIEVPVRCAVFVHPPFALKLDRTRLTQDTAYIHVRIDNPSNIPAQLSRVRLEFPPDAGVVLLEPGSPEAQPPEIPPNSSIQLTWKVLVLSWPFARPLPLRAVLFDRFQLEVASCEVRESIPGSAGSNCGMLANDPVVVNTNDASYEPKPILAELRIYNESDTNRYYHDLHLDLGAAPWLKIEGDEQLRRPDFMIEEDSVAYFMWRLRLWPLPTQEMTQTVFARYHVEADTSERVCSVPIRIRVSGPRPSCALRGQDSLHLHPSGDRFVEDSVEIVAEFHNSGTQQQKFSSARLSSGAWPTEIRNGEEQALSNLDVGVSSTLRWSVRVPRYTFDRTITLTVTAYDSAGRAVTNCKTTLFVPAIRLQCGISTVDSVHYDVSRDRYTPERFEVSATFHNASDTTLANLRAILDSTQLRRVRLTDGQHAVQSIAELLPGETWTPRWELEPVWVDRDAVQLFRVRFEYTPSNASTFCEASSIIGGAPRVAAMACATAGHDTVWTDSFYESLIPDPVQVQYTLRNTGNIPTPACELAILPPPALLLEAGEDSIRSVPVLQPGDAFSAEWLLRIAMDKITPGSWPIRWVTRCADGVQPPQCEHSVFLQERAPEGVVLTPWLLRFEAERNGPLPASRQVQVWTGGGLAPSWSVTSVPAWLDVSPLFGAGHSVLTVGPNTTALPLGEHADRIVLSETPVSTGDVQVVYSIRTPLSVDETARPLSLHIGSVYPNPVSSGATLVVEYRNAAPSEIALSLHDMLGRERLAVTQRGFADGLLSVPTQGLPAGAYVLRLRVGAKVAEKLVMVLP